MQISFLRSPVFYMLFVAALSACSAVGDSPASVISSTEGTTFVRFATVINSRQLPQTAQENSSNTSLRQEIDVRFEDGKTGRYIVDTNPVLQAGDRIKLSDQHGKIRILP